MSITVDTSELTALATSLSRNGARLGAQAAALLRLGARDMETTMRGDAEVETGHMRDSVSSSFAGDGRSGAMAAEVGPTVPYAIYVEEGTAEMQPEPFVGPAFDQHIGPLTEKFLNLSDGLLS